MNSRRKVLDFAWSWLVRHWEKLLVAIAMVVLLVSAYRAAGRKGLGFTPKDLARLVAAAEQHVRNAEPHAPEVTPYDEIIRRIMEPISADDYAFRVPFDPPLWETRTRPTPRLFPVEELVASAGHGVFAMASGGGTRPAGFPSRLGQRWVVVTGLIVHRKQVEAFQQAFAGASFRDPRRDYPDYAYFRVERAEVDPRRPSAGLRWVRQNVRRMFDMQRYWTEPAEAILDKQYLPPPGRGISLAFPLAPRLDCPWGPEVSHPRIPLRTDPDPGDYGGSPPRTGFAWAYNGDFGLPGDGYSPDSPRDASVSVESQNQGQQEYLLRFFDHDVRPGMHYRYRVKLLLANPNSRVPAQYLEEERAAKPQFLETPWSEPTSIVAVPPDTEVLAVAGDSRWRRATVMLVHLDMEAGEYACEEFEVRCGQLLNYPGRTYVPSGTDTPSGTSGEQGPTNYFRSAEPRKAYYLTDMLLLDVRGGERLLGYPRATEPAMLLFADQDGNLVVRSELDDLPKYGRHKPAESGLPRPATLAGRSSPREGRGG